MKFLTPALFVFSFTFSDTIGNAKPFDFRTQVGVVDVSSTNSLCLTIPTANLASGTRVNIVSLNKPQVVAVASIESKLSSSCSPNPDTSDKHSFYFLKLVSGSVKPDGIGIAVVGPKTNFRIANGLASADLNGYVRREYFRLCTSNEGVHLTIWSGKPLKGVRKWHWYYYLGYDVEPNCTSGETQ
jgi:hypothetical protein